MPAQLPALADHRSESGDALARRLSDEFADFSPDAVRRCVADVQARMTHLGLDATPPRVERMAREHLLGMLKSEPPSGRSPGGGDRPDVPERGRRDRRADDRDVTHDSPARRPCREDRVRGI